MGVDCKIYLPPAARVDDVADVIGALAGLKPEKRDFGGGHGGWATHVPYVEVRTTGDSTPTMVRIMFRAQDDSRLIDGEPSHHTFYHFESLDKAGKACRLLMPRSTAFWIAVGRGLIRFFGGSIMFSDSDGTVNETIGAKPARFIHAEDGDDWYRLQEAKLAVQPITPEELTFCDKFAAYKLAEVQAMSRPGRPVEPEFQAFWLNYGQFHCDEHHSGGIPFFFAPADAICAECSGDAPQSYLTRRAS